MITSDLLFTWWLMVYYIIFKLNNNLPNPLLLILISYIIVLIPGLCALLLLELTRHQLQNTILFLILNTLIKGVLIYDLYKYKDKYKLNIPFTISLLVVYISYINYRGHSLLDIYNIQTLINGQSPLEFYVNKYILKNKLILK
jgi:hypothetical protein